jgi:hypothetical protein
MSNTKRNDKYRRNTGSEVHQVSGGYASRLNGVDRWS